MYSPLSLTQLFGPLGHFLIIRDPQTQTFFYVKHKICFHLSCHIEPTCQTYVSMVKSVTFGSWVGWILYYKRFLEDS